MTWANNNSPKWEVRVERKMDKIEELNTDCNLTSMHYCWCEFVFFSTRKLWAHKSIGETDIQYEPTQTNGWVPLRFPSTIRQIAPFTSLQQSFNCWKPTIGAYKQRTEPMHLLHGRETQYDHANDIRNQKPWIRSANDISTFLTAAKTMMPPQRCVAPVDIVNSIRQLCWW